MSTWCKRAAFSLPLAVAGLSAQAQTQDEPVRWVSTATKGFLNSAQMHTLTAVPQLEAASGELMRIIVGMKVHDYGKLRDLASAVTRRGDPNFRNFLTTQRFMDRFAPTERQIERVSAYLRGKGFTNIQVSANRMLISAEGTAGAVKRAFNTPIVRMQKDGRTVYANSSVAQVPDSLGDSVLSVLGLQSVTRVHMMSRTGPHTQKKSAAGIEQGHHPLDFQHIYNASELPTAADTSVAIVTIGGAELAKRDLTEFTKRSHLPVVEVATVKGGKASGNYADLWEGQLEWALDSQSMLGAAGGRVKEMIFYASDLDAPGNAGLTEAFNRVVTDNRAKVINVSLGWCEADAYAEGALETEEQLFTIAVAQGQTFSVASGDEGPYECNNRGFPNGGDYSLSWPASSPHVIAVGGTTLFTHEDGTYASETVWNEGLDETGKLWASTGGYSAFLPMPSWQRTLKVSPAPAGRAVPDIAFDGAQSTGALILSAGREMQVGGTSLSAPLFAGFWARVQSANENIMGSPAASIYSNVAATPVLVHDVTDGSNGYNGYGYEATKGWDYATGWGSFELSRFARYVAHHPFAR